MGCIFRAKNTEDGEVTGRFLPSHMTRDEFLGEEEKTTARVEDFLWQRMSLQPIYRSEGVSEGVDTHGEHRPCPPIVDPYEFVIPERKAGMC